MWEKQTETNGEDEETTRRAASWEEDAEARRPRRAKAEAPPSAARGMHGGRKPARAGGGRGAGSLQARRAHDSHGRCASANGIRPRGGTGVARWWEGLEWEVARRGATVTETGGRRGGGRDGRGAQGRSFENGCPAPPKRSPGYREKQASSSGLGLSRNRKLQKTDYPGPKKKERSLWDLLDSLGQNDAQLRVKLVMNVGLKLEITKNKPRGIHRQR